MTSKHCRYSGADGTPQFVTGAVVMAVVGLFAWTARPMVVGIAIALWWRFW
jgi:hypothetical protein